MHAGEMWTQVRARKTVLTCMLRIVCCGFTGLSYPLPSSHPRGVDSTVRPRFIFHPLILPFWRGCVVWPRARARARPTHKLTLRPLRCGPEILRDVGRTRGVIKRRVNSARRAVTVISGISRIRAIHGSPRTGISATIARVAAGFCSKMAPILER